MNSVIRQLYDGEIFPGEQWAPAFAAFREARQALMNRHEDFLRTLENMDPALAKKFEDLMNADIDNISPDYYAAFYSGFCLGSKLMIEVSQADLGSA